MRILYNSKDTSFKNPFGCLVPNEICNINIHIPASCNATNVWLCTECGLVFELKEKSKKDAYDIFSGEISFERAGLYFYFFRIKTQNEEFNLYKRGYADTNMCEGDMWQVSCIPVEFKTPDSFKGRVIYQIFPDRFHKAFTPHIAGKLTPYTIHSDTKDLPVFLPASNGEILNNDFFGGNLRGIEEKLPYLKSLGVGVIYLNPIFFAFSNHRYDTCDYKKIDPMLGSEDDFKNLCDKAHSLGIKVVLDGVFSHTGSDSIYFDAKRRFGSGVMSNSNSPYKDWYKKKDDGSYESWWGIETLPCVDEMAESFIEYVITGEDSVIKHWLSLGADGFRLDVADELPDEFIALLRKEAKKVKPDCIIIGEVWEDASNKIAYEIRRRYFTDMELDTVMNYPFRNAIIDLCTESISAQDFAHKVMTICENYPKDAVDTLMNSLSTHDTARIMTVLSGAPLGMTRQDCAKYVLSADEIKRARERIFPAVFLLFFFPGSACIYYGDEIGTFAFGDPFNRGYFNWESDEKEILSFYTHMAEIKNSLKVFKDGKFSVCEKDGILYMQRGEAEEKVCSVLNMTDQKTQIIANEILISHNATVYKGCAFVGKYGFVMYR